jgi:hypothetical protein
MKKSNLLTISILILAIFSSCSKDNNSSSSQNCSWTNTYLANKTFKVTAATGGSGSSRDSLEGIYIWEFTTDSLTLTRTTITPFTIQKGTFNAGIENGLMTIRMNGTLLPLVISEFSCTGFKYKSSTSTEPYIYTLAKQ